MGDLSYLLPLAVLTILAALIGALSTAGAALLQFLIDYLFAFPVT